MSRHAPSTDYTEVRIEALDLHERAVAIDLRILRDIVEIYVNGRNRGVTRREVLRAWLWMPFSTLPVDDVTFRLDTKNENHARITIEVWPDLGPWPISPSDDQRLREAL